jgi:hypothetical protein
VLLQLAGERVRGDVAVAQHDDGADDGAALGIGRRHHRRLGDRLVRREGGLDLERADPVARGDDHVVEAALEVQVAVLVAPHPVPRRHGPPAARSTASGSPRKRRKNVGTVDGSTTSSPSATSSDTPGSARPIEPGRAGVSRGIPVSCPVSVCP